MTVNDGTMCMLSKIACSFQGNRAIFERDLKKKQKMFGLLSFVCFVRSFARKIGQPREIVYQIAQFQNFK